MLSADALRDYLAYTSWASRRLLDAAAQLTPEQLTQDFRTSDRDLLGTLTHVFAADRIWLERVHGNSPATFVTESDRQLAALVEQWPGVLDAWQEYGAGLTDATAAEDLPYRDMRGNAWKQPIWQIVLHVVNHGTHHRGQAAGFMRAMGVAPPPLDLVVFYRTRREHTSRPA